MSIRNMLNECFVFNHFWKKYVLRQRGRLSNAQCLKRLYGSTNGGQNAHRTQVFGKCLFPDSNLIPSWKWLLAIPVVMNVNDGKSESKVIHIVLCFMYYQLLCYSYVNIFKKSISFLLKENISLLV